MIGYKVPYDNTDIFVYSLFKCTLLWIRDGFYFSKTKCWDSHCLYCLFLYITQYKLDLINFLFSDVHRRFPVGI